MAATTKKIAPVNAPVLRLYLRRSLDADKQAESIDTQRAIAARFAVGAALAWADRVEYLDENRSGDDFSRPGLSALIEAACPGDVVLVYDDSRLGRDALMTALVLRRLIREKGARVIYAATGTEATAEDGTADLVNVARGLGAEGELRKIRQRTKDALHARAADGYAAGLLPYGYRSERINADDTKSKKRIALVEAEAEIVRRIFRLFLGGKGPRGIARQLNRDGVPNRKGRAWTWTAVWHMLRHPAYRGTFKHGEVTTIRPDLAIVDVDTAAAVAEELAGRKTDVAAQVAANATHLLSGVLRCTCGSPMTIKTSEDAKGRGTRRLYYVCKRRKDSLACDNRKHHPKPVTEAAVIAYLRDVFLSTAAEVVHQEIDAEIADLRAEGAGDAAGIRADLEVVKAKRARAVKLALETDDEEVARHVKALASEVRSLEQRLAVAERPAIGEEAAQRIHEAVNAGLARLAEGLAATDPETVRQSLRATFPDGIALDADGNAEAVACVQRSESEPFLDAPVRSDGGAYLTYVLPSDRGRKTKRAEAVKPQ